MAKADIQTQLEVKDLNETVKEHRNGKYAENGESKIQIRKQ
jgi:hypothetical protein